MNLRGSLLTTTQAAECQVEVDTLARNPRVTSQVSREELCTSKQCGPTSHIVLCPDCYFAERIFSAGVNTVVWEGDYLAYHADVGENGVFVA